MKLSNLQLRIISALVLVPLVVFAILKGGVFYSSFITLAALIMCFEWHNLISKKKSKYTKFWKLGGIIYIFVPTMSMIWIRDLSNGLEITLWMVAVVCSTDIFAYFTGRTLGGPKLAPNISPNKTWSGLIGGVLAACLIGVITGFIHHGHHKLALTLLSGLLAIYAQIGDLSESWIKRHFGVKDSGKIIPGHGGILDRVDGFILVAPKVALIALIDKGGLF